MKSANVFLTRLGEVKLGDLNVSTITVQNGLHHTQTGTPYYASPEVWRDEPYDKRSDVWSMGVLLYELTTLSLPFKGKSMKDLYDLVCSGEFKPIPASFSKDLALVLHYTLQVQMQKRPTVEDVLQLPAVASKLKKVNKLKARAFKVLSRESKNTLSLS